jgi:hypothetical protein
VEAVGDYRNSMSSQKHAKRKVLYLLSLKSLQLLEDACRRATELGGLIVESNIALQLQLARSPFQAKKKLRAKLTLNNSMAASTF